MKALFALALALSAAALPAWGQSQQSPIQLGSFVQNSPIQVILTTGQQGQLGAGSLPPGTQIGGVSSAQSAGIHSLLIGMPNSAGSFQFSLQVSSGPFSPPQDEWFSITIAPTFIKSGIYWDPAQGGTGWAIQFAPGADINTARIFIAAYGYLDGAGAPGLWLAGTLYATGGGGFSGQLLACSGGNGISTAVAADITPACAPYQPPAGASLLSLQIQTNATAALSLGTRTASLTLFDQF